MYIYIYIYSIYIYIYIYIYNNLFDAIESGQSEIRAVIRFLHAKGHPSTLIHLELALFVVMVL